MPEKNRSVRIVFENNRPGETKVSVAYLAKALRSFQQILNLFGQVEMRKREEHFNSGPSEVRKQCELSIFRVEEGSLVFEARLPDRTSSRGDFSLAAFDVFGNAISAVATDAIEQLQGALPLIEDREKYFRLISDLIPTEESGVYVIFQTDGMDSPALIQPNAESVIRRFRSLGLLASSEVTVQGELISLSGARSGRRELKILYGEERKISCRYSHTLDEEIRPLMIGSTIELKGKGFFNEYRQITRLDDVIEIRTAKIPPVKLDVLALPHRSFILQKPIGIEVHQDGNYWTIEHSRLGIIATEKNRSEALVSFAEEFGFIWDEYAEEENENLTLDARELKQLLLSLVKEIKGGRK